MRTYNKHIYFLLLLYAAFYNAAVKSQPVRPPVVLPGPVGPFVVPEPESKDCKAIEACTMHDGTPGFCHQIFCKTGKKCFTCLPGTGPGYI